MMKDMYEDGDDNMKRVIGEAMMKAQRGGTITLSYFLPFFTFYIFTLTLISLYSNAHREVRST